MREGRARLSGFASEKIYLPYLVVTMNLRAFLLYRVSSRSVSLASTAPYLESYVHRNTPIPHCINAYHLLEQQIFFEIDLSPFPIDARIHSACSLNFRAHQRPCDDAFTLLRSFICYALHLKVNWVHGYRLQRDEVFPWISSYHSAHDHHAVSWVPDQDRAFLYYVVLAFDPLTLECRRCHSWLSFFLCTRLVWALSHLRVILFWMTSATGCFSNYISTFRRTWFHLLALTKAKSYSYCRNIYNYESVLSVLPDSVCAHSVVRFRYFLW